MITNAGADAAPIAPAPRRRQTLPTLARLPACALEREELLRAHARDLVAEHGPIAARALAAALDEAADDAEGCPHGDE
jgi:hypothetical protein